MKSNKRLIIFLILFVVAVVLYFFYKEGTLPVNRSATDPKVFTIETGESMDQITRSLASEDLIRNRVVFYMVVKQLGIEKQIQAGDFRLSQSMDVYEIARALTHGTQDKWVTIIEGLRKEEIAEALAKKFGISEVEFVKAAPEGYLFPDTYSAPSQASADTLITLLTNTFNQKYQAEVAPKTAHLNMTKEQIVTMASLVEREARTEEDRRMVASILLKRIANDWPLQLDATVQYAIGYQPVEKTWWKRDLTVDDLKVNSPYNTYLNKGLPPGPICNPSISSLLAVANADPETPYWYYLSEPGGTTHFAKTLEEHDANIQKYLR